MASPKPIQPKDIIQPDPEEIIVAFNKLLLENIHEEMAVIKYNDLVKLIRELLNNPNLKIKDRWIQNALNEYSHVGWKIYFSELPFDDKYWEFTD